MAVVVRVAVGVDAVEKQRGLHGIVVLGLRAADQCVQAQFVGELMSQIQRDLIELGRELVVTRLGPDIDVVKHAVNHVIRRVDLVREDVHSGAAGRAARAEIRSLEEILGARGIEVRIQQIQGQLRALARPKLQRACDAQALEVMAEDPITR